VYAILKNVPKGLISLIIYSITVYIAYPAYGIYTGTALAYAIATLYLAVTQLELNMRIKS
jgi:hypothetical protein